MKLVDFPRWMRALLVFTLLLCFCNLILFLAPVPFVLQSYGLKIDPGLAALIGAIVGFSVVGYQARLGFKNLIRSQQNQAALDRQAREHQQQLEIRAREAEQGKERELLLAGLAAELNALHDHFHHLRNHAAVLKAVLEVGTEQGADRIAKSIEYKTVSTPLFDANVNRLGLLGMSLAADVVYVVTRAKLPVNIQTEKPMDNRMAAKLYEGLVTTFENQRDDIGHVVRRIIAFENGAPASAPDPGTLYAFQEARSKSKAK
jgi:hypothetical protein